ncbi:LysR substrate-binding domain-containing protein [Celeribacter litoreus]|uniref:LysR substrate-binding domain-containing protein n=1 Tax=Celeribacter litoreus TaxID=2876714 RepID=UPI001CCCE449|nr:LysR substrate-binding domain-containing protein [Celeribacter litoreus]MCA0044845.1 LysR family transcriptional regulator [Celeribacter litoreus]
MRLARQIKPTHLDLVLRISEVGQLQVAARALNMTQPAASRILSEIEDRCGALLFKRTPKGMEITPTGEAFVRHARVVLSGLDGLEKEVASLTQGISGEVRIGSVTGPAVGILLPAMAVMRERTPDISLSIEVAPSTDLIRGLDEGRFDFILARVPSTHDGQDLHIHPARSETVRLMVRESHPLAGQSSVPLDALGDYDWVIQERGSPIREAMEQAFYSVGVEVPQRVVHTSSLLMVEALLATSDIIAPQSREVAELLTGPDFGAKLTMIDTATEMTVTPYFVIRNTSREMPSSAKLFYEEILRHL